MTDQMPAPASSSLAVKIDTVRGWIHGQRAEIAKALPQGMDAERFARIALTQVLRNPKLAECDKASFVLAIMEAAALGLEPDSVSGLSYLVPFKNRVQLIPGYQGLIQLAYRHPKVTQIDRAAVYEGDTWDYRAGTDSRIVHVPARRQTAPKPEEIVACYAIARIRGGGRPQVWLWREEIETQHRDRSPSYKQGYGPWFSDPIAMYIKTPVRALAKIIPQSPQLMQALSIETDPEAEAAPGSPYVGEAKVGEILDAIAGGTAKVESNGNQDEAPA